MKWLIYNAFLLFIMATRPAAGQVRNGSDTLPAASASSPVLERAVQAVERFASLRPQEKLYLHFDKPYYAAGDHIWFRAYLVNASSHTPSPLSEIVHVELIAPADTVIQRLALYREHGNFNGDFDLPDELPAGRYRIRAYTEWMRNTGHEFFFTREIPIGNTRLSNVETDIEYEVDRTTDPPEITAVIRFTDNNGEAIAGRDVSYEHVLIGKPRSPKTAVTDEQGTIHVPVPYNESPLYPNKYIRTSINFDGLPFMQDHFLPSFKDDISLSFFPEGGNLIAGVPNIVAFKAIDASGMGKLTLHPVAGEHYVARLQRPDHAQRIQSGPDEHTAPAKNVASGEYPLPAVLEEGYLLSILPGDSLIRVNIAASSARLRNRPVFLLAQSRGQVCYAAQAVLEKELYQAAIPFARFPGGITQFTLFDAEGAPVAERLVFVPPHDRLRIRVQPDRPVYGAREQVKLDIAVMDEGGHPVKGSFSISVTDASVVDPATLPGMLAGLLLTSDLRGYVEDPAWYFDPRHPGAAGALDLLMLTQGWRRFTWEHILAGDPGTISYAPEKGFEITGTVYDDSGDPLPHARLVLLAGRGRDALAAEDTADAAGRFRFAGHAFPDSTRVLLQARNEKGRRYGEIRIDDDKPRIRMQPERFPPDSPDSMAAYLAMNKEHFIQERERLGLSSILLDPVEVTATKKAPNSTGLHSYADNIITAEDIERMGSPATIYDILRGRVPGLQVIGRRVIIRGINTFYGNTDPLVVVDGVRSMDASVLGMVNPFDVASIEILKGANAAIYGMGAANGVIVINTKRGEYQPKGAFERRGVVSFFPEGYHVEREFYVPEYEVPRNLRDKTPDLRSTIYWNGDVQTGEDGSATVSFYTADRPAPYMVIMEGISESGKPGEVKTFLERE